MADLRRCHRDAFDLSEESGDVVVDRAGHLFPRRAEFGAALVHVGASRVGELEAPSAVLFCRLHETLVLELRERRVDRACARAPHAVRAGLNLLHQLIAVARGFGEQEKRGRANVSTAGTRTAAPKPGAAEERRAAAAEGRSMPVTHIGQSRYIAMVPDVKSLPTPGSSQLRRRRVTN